jgi:hypothetical protein
MFGTLVLMVESFDLNEICLKKKMVPKYEEEAGENCEQ